MSNAPSPQIIEPTLEEVRRDLSNLPDDPARMIEDQTALTLYQNAEKNDTTPLHHFITSRSISRRAKARLFQQLVGYHQRRFVEIGYSLFIQDDQLFSQLLEQGTPTALRTLLRKLDRPDTPHPELRNQLIDRIIQQDPELALEMWELDQLSLDDLSPTQQARLGEGFLSLLQQSERWIRKRALRALGELDTEVPSENSMNRAGTSRRTTRE